MTQAEERILRSNIAELRYAIRSGADEVSYSDKRVRYRSLAEMRHALKEMEAELSGIPVRRSRIHTYTSSDKGL